MTESRVKTSYKKLYVREHVKRIGDFEYERMFDHIHKYRVIFSDDDYDYVTDKYAIAILDNHFE